MANRLTQPRCLCGLGPSLSGQRKVDTAGSSDKQKKSHNLKMNSPPQMSRLGVKSLATDNFRPA
jgi:hypothetical protein